MSKMPTPKPVVKNGPGLPLEQMPRENPHAPDGALTKEFMDDPYDPELAEWLRDFIRKSGWSHKEVAKPLRVKDSNVTNYLRKRGPIGRWQEVQKNARDFRFGVQLRQDLQQPMLKVASASGTAADQGVHLVETFAAKKMHNYLEDTRGEAIISVVLGRAGVGKTSGLQLYLEKHPNTLTFTAWRGERSEAAITAALLGQLPPRTPDASRRLGSSRAVQLRNALAGTNVLIAIDQAQALPKPALEFLVGLHDQTKCPMALIGNPDILEHIKRLDPPTDAQNQSRVLKLYPITLGPEGDSKEQTAARERCELEMAQAMIAGFFPDRAEEIEEQIGELALEVLRGKGHGRALWSRLNTLRRLLQKDSHKGVPLTDAFDDAGERCMQSEAVALYTEARR